MLTELHHVRTSDGIRLALHRLLPEGQGPWPAVLLVPGTFSQRSLWLGTRGEGLARHLTTVGLQTWTAELRGHGQSDRPPRWTMQDWIRQDAPALVDYVSSQSPDGRLFWVGHSSGGVVGAALAGHRPAVADSIAGFVLLGAPAPGGLGVLRRLGAGAAELTAMLLPGVHVSGRAIRMGPEREPTALIREWMGWNLRGAWRTPEGGDYLAGLAGVDLPLLAVAGAGDRVFAPPAAVRDLVRRFGSRDASLVVAGTRTGFQVDFGHGALVASRAAREEIWPLVTEWLTARAVSIPPRKEGS